MMKNVMVLLIFAFEGDRSYLQELSVLSDETISSDILSVF